MIIDLGQTAKTSATEAVEKNQMGNHQFDARPFEHVKPELVGLALSQESQEETHVVADEEITMGGGAFLRTAAAFQERATQTLGSDEAEKPTPMVNEDLAEVVSAAEPSLPYFVGV